MALNFSFEIVSVTEAPLMTRQERHRPVVLIVDDERIIADTLATVLARNGFAPCVAYDARSALEIASVIPPEVLISDVVMPGMNGVELAINVMREVPDCKVLLFSGQVITVDLLAEAWAEGHRFVTLEKPIHPTELLVAIAESLAGIEPYMSFESL